MRCFCVICGLPVEAPNPNLACCSLCNVELHKKMDLINESFKKSKGRSHLKISFLKKIKNWITS